MAILTNQQITDLVNAGQIVLIDCGGVPVLIDQLADIPSVLADCGFRELATPQTLTGAGAISLNTADTLLTTTGANALTLAAGTEGQYKFIKLVVDGGDATVTVTNLQGGTQIVFNDVGDFVYLYYRGSKWNILTNSGCSVS